MRESFGARLRQRRERQHITLATIADDTKIKLSLLEGLERDDLSHWPDGIFRRAFVRAYAHAIGLEPDVVVREFHAVYPDPTDEASAEPAIAPGDMRSGRAKPPTRLRYLVGSAIGSFSLFRPEPAQAHQSGESDLSIGNRTLPPVRASFEPDVIAAARVCTALGRLDRVEAASPLLAEMAATIDAAGLIVWVWDARTTELKPSIAYGYSEKVLAQLPAVTQDADNATAAAFRSAQTCFVSGSEILSGAVVVPLAAPSGCVGVLAVELRPGVEATMSMQALMSMFAAQLARCVGAPRSIEVPERLLA